MTARDAAIQGDRSIPVVSVMLVTTDSATVCATAEVLGELRTALPGEVVVAESPHGLGSAVWSGLFETAGDVLVVVEVDRHGPPVIGHVRALVEALAAEADLQLAIGAPTPPEPDRLVDLVVRPGLAVDHPQLATIGAPNPSLWATRRDHLEMMPIPVGAGAGLAMLLDTDLLYGPEAIVEVPLAPQPSPVSPPTDPQTQAVQLMVVLKRRQPERVSFSEEPIDLQIATGATVSVPVRECPPAAAIPGYRDGVASRLAAHRGSA